MKKRDASRRKFIQLCQHLKENRERLLVEKPSAKQYAREVQGLGINISVYLLRKAQEATGVQWRGTLGNPFLLGRGKALVNIVVELCRKNNIIVPKELADEN